MEWEVQFEYLIGLTKQRLYRSIKRSQLAYNEFEEILFDVETNWNNLSLAYVKDDIQLNVLTTNSMIHGRDVSTINSNSDNDSDEWTKKQRCKALREKCLYLELFWSAFSCVRTEYGEIQSISPYSVQTRENVDQNNFEYRYFLCSEENDEKRTREKDGNMNT